MFAPFFHKQPNEQPDNTDMPKLESKESAEQEKKQKKTRTENTHTKPDAQ